MHKHFFEFAVKHKLKLLIACAVLTIVILAPTIIVNLSTRSERFSISELQSVPENEVTIVLGAGVLPDGTPTPYLKNRIATAVDLYKAGRTKKLLMSGDNSEAHYNEPEVMKHYAESLGVKSEDIILDFAGFNTYDSCYRANKIFGLTNAIIVTQGYHLPRAVVTCKGLGINTVGVAAKKQGRDFTVTYILREYISTNKALLQLIFKPQPKLLGDPTKI
jgi:vancomycin permeability regulator SanA